MKLKIFVIVAIAAIGLSACTGPNLGTETDNTDIVVPTNTQMVVDSAHQLIFEFGEGWKHDGDLEFRPLNAIDDSYVVTTIIEDVEVVDLEAFAEQDSDEDFVRDEDADLETVVASRNISGGRVDEMFILRDDIVIHLYGVFTGFSATAAFPVSVESTNEYTPVNTTVCIGGCDSELKTPYSQAGTYGTTQDGIKVLNGDDGDLEVAGGTPTYEMAPGSQPTLQIQQIAPVTVDDDE